MKKHPFKRYSIFGLTAVFVAAATLFLMSRNIPTTNATTDTTGVGTDLNVSNYAPSFTNDPYPSDGGSSATTPTTEGDNVVFTAPATDSNNNNYYLAICKTNSITAHDNAAPTCASGENLCVSSSSVASESEATCSFNTTGFTAESQDWYAFVCDDTDGSQCSAAEQGNGDTGSPFYVNHPSSFTDVKIGPTCGSNDPVPPGNSIFGNIGDFSPAYRWRNDDGSETTATFPGSERAPMAGIAQNTGMRLRMAAGNPAEMDSELIRKATTALQKGEDNFASAVVDTVHGYAYFGSNDYPAVVVKVALGTGSNPPRRIGAVTMNDGENNLLSAVIDTTNNYAYFGTSDSPGKIVKIALGTGDELPRRVGAVTMNDGENNLLSAVIDTDNAYAYFGTSDWPGKIVKIALGTGDELPRRVGAVAMNEGEGRLASAVIDTTNNYAYFGTSNSPGKIVKIALGTGDELPRRVGAVTMNDGEDYPSSAVIDSTKGYAYFGTAYPGKVIKIALGTGDELPRRVDAVTMNYGENYLVSAVIDTTNNYAYFGTATYPGVVIKIALGTDDNPPTRVDAVVMNSEDSIGSAVIDAANGYVYLGTTTSPGVVVKIALGTGDTPPRRVGAITLNSGEDYLYSAVIDSTKGYAYFGTSDWPGKIVKIALGTGDELPRRVGAVTMNDGEDSFVSAVIDTTNNYAYFGTSDWPSSAVVKIALGTGDDLPRRVDALTFNNGEYSIQAALIDPAKGYGYFSPYNEDEYGGIIIKVALGTGDAPLRRVGTITLNSGENSLGASVIDTANGYAYYGAGFDSPSKIVKVALGAGDELPRRVGALDLYDGEHYMGRYASIDTINGYAYFETGGDPKEIIKIALGPGDSLPTRAGAITANDGESFSIPVIDPVNGYLYSFTSLGLAKISITSKLQFRLEYGVKTTSCSTISSWTQVPATATSGEAWQMASSANLTDGEPTTNVADGLTDTNITFKPGQVKTADSQTSPITLSQNDFTELEYSIKATSNSAIGATYCFRLTNAGATTPLTDYLYPEAIVSTTNSVGTPANMFGNGGKVTTAIGTEAAAKATAIQSDGKIVVAGSSGDTGNTDFTLARYNADGSLDTGFGTGGIVTTSISSGNDVIKSIAIQSDGKIVAAVDGNNDSSVGIVRYNADGSPDTGFGTGGIVMLDFGDDSSALNSVAIQSDGKIIVGGYSGNLTPGNHVSFFALARYNADGSRDNSFGDYNNGITTADGGGYFSGANSIAIQSDGKIVAAGWGHNNNSQLVRFTANGSKDTGFGTDGIVTTADNSFTASAVTIDSNGKIVVAGRVDTPTADGFVVSRFNADGSPDTGFGTDGIVRTTIGSADGAYGVSIDSNGKIVAVGNSDNSFAAVRYNADGTPDTSFGGGDGIVTTAIGSSAIAYGVAIDGSGKIFAAGKSDNSFAVVRYNPDSSPAFLDFFCAQMAVNDPDTNPTANTVDMYVCDTNSFVNGACGGATLCSATGVASGSNAQCIAEHQVPVPTAHGSYPVYVFIKDNHGLQGTGTNAQNLTVADAPPRLVSYSATDSPAPPAGGYDTVDYSVSLTDDNGDRDVSNVKGVFFDKTLPVTHSCAANENNCYISANCTLTDVSSSGTGKTATGTDNGLGANCSAQVWYNALPGDWDVEAVTTDGNGDTPFADAGVSLNNPEQLGIDVVDHNIVYGLVAINGTSEGQTTRMANMGNQPIDVYISGNQMCSPSSQSCNYNIPSEQQKWSTSQAFDWDTAGDALVTTPSGDAPASGCYNANIGVRADHTIASTDTSVIWKLRIPASQHGGSYSGQNTFTTTADNTCQ